jgi:hypothetical protein
MTTAKQNWIAQLQRTALAAESLALRETKQADQWQAEVEALEAEMDCVWEARIAFRNAHPDATRTAEQADTLAQMRNTCNALQDRVDTLQKSIACNRTIAEYERFRADECSKREIAVRREW